MKTSNDILEMFEVLSNHEVFTPPRIARQMLDLLPPDVWIHPEYRFLDPATKSGVFLREIFYRLFEGLKGKGKHLAHDGQTYDLDDPQQRANHILKNMVFGIATSELTAYLARRTLYGVMRANTSKQNAALASLDKAYGKHSIPQDVLDRICQSEKASESGRYATVFNDYYDPQLFSAPEYRGFEDEGNIFYPIEEVKIKKLEVECEVIKQYEFEESYFPFINNETAHQKILEIKDGKMKFDVIIGNPPYQLKTDGYGAQAKPIYHKFVEQGISLKPRYVSMIIPSRWFSGGMGLDGFRAQMLSDRRLREIVDNPKLFDVFKAVEIKGGVCYFLWDEKHTGDCKVTTMIDGVVASSVARDLRGGNGVLVRSNESGSIIEKVSRMGERTLDSMVSSINPFNFPTNFNDCFDHPQEGMIKIYRRKQVSWIYRAAVRKNTDWIDKYKVITPKAADGHGRLPMDVLGKPVVCMPGSVCTMTYIVAGVFEKKEHAENYAQYISTKFVRYLVSLRKSAQNVSSGIFSFVPIVDMNTRWTDQSLYRRYGLSPEEIEHIEEMIKPAEGVVSE